MGMFDGYAVPSSGLAAQRSRINVISANIANANTTHTEDGGPYKKKNVVFEEVLMKEKANATNSNLSQAVPISGVAVKAISEAPDQPVMKYEPSHPDANKDGYVAYPNVNPVMEMVDLIEAMRSYEANVSTFQAQKQMDTQTLDILKG